MADPSIPFPASSGPASLGMRRGLRIAPWRVGCWLVALAVAAPLAGVLANLATPGGDALAHLAATTLPGILLNTLLIMLWVGIGTGFVGVATAWLVTMCRFPGSRLLEWALLLPLAMPAYIIGYAYTDFLAFAGPVQSAMREAMGWRRGDYWFPDIHSTGGVGLMFTLVLYPYVYLLARAAFLEQSVCVLEASRVLGSRPWRSFLRVALPLARPAIAAGVALALMEALADFGTVQYFGIQTFTTAIYRTWFGLGDRAAAAQLASLLLVVVLVLLVLERASRGEARVHQTSRRHREIRPLRLGGWRAVAAALGCALPVLLGFVVPVAILTALHLKAGDDIAGSTFAALAGNSLLLAVLAALVTVAAALVLGYGLRRARDRWTLAAIRFATMGYAIPGTVIAVGVVIWLGRFDNALDAWLTGLLGVSTGLLLSGSIVALLFAYLVRFLSVAASAIDSGLGRITPSMDDAARTLGAPPLRVLVRVHAPMMRGSVLTAATLVFVDVLKELPATLLVRPFNFETLAVHVYALASDERLAQAATSALAIVVVGLAPVAILSAMIRRARVGAEIDAAR
jgi:iron(III) transport system permease protein